jgi:hypothetical protein
MVPNGVSSGRPPAKGLPLAAVWHTMQSPTLAMRAPRASSAWSSLAGGGPGKAVRAGCHA